MKTLFPLRQTHRSTLRRAFLLILAVLVVTAALTTGPARARTPSTVVTTTILPVPGVKSTFDNIDIFAKTDRNLESPPPDWWMAQLRTKGPSDLFVVRNAFAAGATTGWHTHPGPSMVTVTAGRVTVYDGDDPNCSPHVFDAGNTFVDPTSNNHVHLVRNETGLPAETIAVQLVPAGAGRRLDRDNPNTTGFCSTIN